ncbi:hypothetical protein Tco_0583890, partial [Tanacetum coccineum]
MMLQNLDQLRLQFERKPLHANNAKSCLKKLQTQFQEFFNSEAITSSLENEVKEIKETDKPLNEAIPHEHETEKSFKLQSKDVQINLVQAVDANLVVTKSSGIESENNRSVNALNKSVNETQMKMQEGKVDMGKALDDGLVVTKSS